MGLAIVIGLAVPALSMNTGQPLVASFSSSTPAARTLAALEREGVPRGVVFPVQILTHGGDAAAQHVARVADATPGVYTTLIAASAGDDRLVSVIGRAEPSTAEAKALVNTLRSRLPGAQVGGNAAQAHDFVHTVYGNVPLMLAVLALVTFLLLARAFRSVVLALKAVVLNVISLGAAYGFLVLFWQEGHGSSLVYGVPATESIRDFIPILVFAFLFGLSMDDEVFLLARLREEHDRTGDTSSSIVGSLSRTGRLVTSAAVILAIPSCR